MIALLFAGFDRIVVDRDALAALFTKEPELHAYVTSAIAPAALRYIAVLLLIAWLCGDLYGRALRANALAGGSSRYLDGAESTAGVFGRVAALLYRHLWRLFYAQFEQPLYAQVLQQSYAFVHTNKGLYHGILYNLDKARDGELEGIDLVHVSKFSNKTEEECYAAGENPIRELSGPLFIKWSEIADINYPPDDSVLKAKGSTTRAG